jgi:hypothetical protein
VLVGGLRWVLCILSVIVRGQQAQIRSHDTAYVLDFNVPFDRVHMAEADPGCVRQVGVSRCRSNFDRLFVESSCFLTLKVTRLWIDPGIVDDRMLTWVTAPLESTLAIVRGNCAYRLAIRTIINQQWILTKHAQSSS